MSFIIPFLCLTKFEFGFSGSFFSPIDKAVFASPDDSFSETYLLNHFEKAIDSLKYCFARSTVTWLLNVWFSLSKVVYVIVSSFISFSLYLKLLYNVASLIVSDGLLGVSQL